MRRLARERLEKLDLHQMIGAGQRNKREGEFITIDD
jgi:hypothetical protein